eukprot:gene12490-2279_t
MPEADVYVDGPVFLLFRDKIIPGMSLFLCDAAFPSENTSSRRRSGIYKETRVAPSIPIPMIVDDDSDVGAASEGSSSQEEDNVEGCDEQEDPASGVCDSEGSSESEAGDSAHGADHKDSVRFQEGADNKNVSKLARKPTTYHAASSSGLRRRQTAEANGRDSETEDDQSGLPQQTKLRFKDDCSDNTLPRLSRKPTTYHPPSAQKGPAADPSSGKWGTRFLISTMV